MENCLSWWLPWLILISHILMSLFGAQSVKLSSPGKWCVNFGLVLFVLFVCINFKNLPQLVAALALLLPSHKLPQAAFEPGEVNTIFFLSHSLIWFFCFYSSFEPGEAETFLSFYVSFSLLEIFLALRYLSHSWKNQEVWIVNLVAQLQ